LATIDNNRWNHGGKQQPPGLSTKTLRPKRAIRRKPKTIRSTELVDKTTPGQIPGVSLKPEIWMEFGKSEMPSIRGYYRSHEGLSLHGRLRPLFNYPVEVLANCRNFRFVDGTISGYGKAILKVQPPPRLPNLSNHEFYALWAEDTLRYAAKAAAQVEMSPLVRRYQRNLEVLKFMRACWDALMVGYQQERAWYLKRYNLPTTLCSNRLQGAERFKSQLVYHPLEAAQRLKRCAQANRAWYFGGPKPHGRLLVMREKIPAMMSSYVARALPPPPKDDSGLKGLLERLTSTPKPEPPYWRPFLKSYVQRWGPIRPPIELYTMPSSNAALGLSRAVGGHTTGVQHLVLLGYALKKIRGQSLPPSMRVDSDGSYLELLSDALHPHSQHRKVKDGLEEMFRQPWDELEKTLPGCGEYLQDYLKVGVEYVMQRITYIPIFPICAEEKGLKTRFPTCSLTAANLVQQVLRRVADYVMIRDPRFSEALGGSGGISLEGEQGPWDSQDCTAATDYHPEWLTRGFYEELAERYPPLRRYQCWFTKLFGPKKILTCVQEEAVPHDLLENYPRAPLLDDEPMKWCLMRDRRPGLDEQTQGHAYWILHFWDQWIDNLNALPGTVTTTGQMMGDPTSFPPLMLVTLCAQEQALKEYPYTPKERRRAYPRLSRSEAKLKGIGDDAIIPRQTPQRRKIYYDTLKELSVEVSWSKCFYHPTRGIIAEIPLEAGFEVPFWPTSVLVAPPGGSKGEVNWVSQPTSFGGDLTRPTRSIPKFFWKLSPYYYTWMLAYRLGLPLGAPEAWGGIGLPILPPRSSLWHVQWLSYLTQRTKKELIIGLGLAPFGNSGQSLLDKAAGGWVEDVLSAAPQWEKEGLTLLTPYALTESAERRINIVDAYRSAVSKVRSVEFYFRPQPRPFGLRAPSVRMASQRFGRKVGHTIIRGSGMKYGPTIQDVGRKLEIYFQTSGGFLPDPWAKPSSVYGLERSTEVKVRRQFAPWLVGLG